MTPEQVMHGEALDWAIRVDDPSFEDWPALEAWLARSARHAALFDQACDNIAMAASAMAPTCRLRLVETTPQRSPASGKLARRSLPIGIAAALAGVIAGGVAILPGVRGEKLQHIATLPGETRTIALADNSRIVLNGDSQAIVGARNVELKRGQASFTVIHNAAAPFSVIVGGAVIRDIGTRFDVRIAGHGTEVAVAEGTVAVETAGGAVTLKAAERTFVPDGKAPDTPEPIDPDAVSSWRAGQLTFEDSSYGEVIEAVRRRTGLPVTLAPGLEANRFAGTLTVNGTPASVMERLAETLDLRARPLDHGWIMTPPSPGR